MGNNEITEGNKMITKKDVAIIGGGMNFAARGRLVKESQPPVIVLPAPETCDLEINGVKYALRPSNPGDTRMSAPAATLILQASMYGVRQSTLPKIPDVNIVEEFKLIQDKKSNLSRSDRDAVVRKFNELFRPIQSANQQQEEGK